MALKVLLFSFVFMAFSPAQAAQLKLNSIEAAGLDSQQARIVLKFNHRAPKIAVDTQDKPKALVIKLPDTDINLIKKRVDIHAGPLKTLTGKTDQNSAQLNFTLTQNVKYSIRRQQNKITITAKATSQAPAPRHSAHNKTQRIEGVDFHRTADGKGQIKLKLNDLKAQAKITHKGEKIIATLPGIYVPKKYEKHLEVIDFATPVASVDVFNHNNSARIVIRPVGTVKTDYQAYQSDDAFTLEIAQKQKENETAKGQANKQFHGEKVSLSLQKINIRSVLQIIADTADVNMVISDSVSGDITLQLDDVPWDQALNIILRTKGLGMRHMGNVISVAPLDEITKREQAEKAAQDATQEREPLESEIVQINYAEAGGIAQLIKAQKGENSMLSKRGQITVDKRTNSLVINDTAARLTTIKRVISQLDLPVRQVQIEARIVVANRSFSREIGISQDANYNSNSTHIGNSGYQINLPTPSSGGKINTIIKSSRFSLDLALSALETEEEGEIISAPRIVTTDGQQAMISQGQEVPYVTKHGTSDSATTEFKEVELNLTVTPHITPDNHVLLNLELTQDSVNSISEEGEPVIDTRGVTNQALVADGNTVVLGGIYQHEKRNSNSRVPILGKIPLIGWLFSGSQSENNKKELLIFITPTILDPTLTDQLSSDLAQNSRH